MVDERKLLIKIYWPLTPRFGYNKKKLIEHQTKPKLREVTFCGHRAFM